MIFPAKPPRKNQPRGWWEAELKTLGWENAIDLTAWRSRLKHVKAWIFHGETALNQNFGWLNSINHHIFDGKTGKTPYEIPIFPWFPQGFSTWGCDQSTLAQALDPSSGKIRGAATEARNGQWERWRGHGNLRLKWTNNQISYDK